VQEISVKDQINSSFNSRGIQQVHSFSVHCSSPCDLDPTTTIFPELKINAVEPLAVLYMVPDGFEGIRILGLKENLEAINKLNTSNMTTLYQSEKVIAKYLLDRGQIRQIPDFEEIIDPRFVYAIFRNDTKTHARIIIS
jgi:hypothetical protein